MPCQKGRQGNDNNLLPNVPFNKCAGDVASPVATCPSQTLLEEFRVVLESGQHFAFRVILHVCLVTVVHHPPGQEIVIVSIELIAAEEPRLVCESIGKVALLDDAGTVGTSASGDARHTAVNVGGGRTVEVPTFQIQCTQESIDALRKIGILCTSQSLAGDHTSIGFVFEGSQHPLKGMTRPRDIVIGEDNDLGSDLGDGPSHLPSLVCLFDRHAANTVVLSRRHLLDESLRPVHTVVDGDQDQFSGFIFHDRGDGPLQLFPFTIQGGQDDRDI